MYISKFHLKLSWLILTYILVPKNVPSPSQVVHKETQVLHKYRSLTLSLTILYNLTCPENEQNLSDTECPNQLYQRDVHIIFLITLAAG